VTVEPRAAEQARARMLAVFPEGFEEGERGDRLELTAYTDERGEARARAEFGDVVLSDIPDDWEERWKLFHRPVRVAGLWVGPPWETPPAEGTAVVIDPGRAFGTGSHQTTRLCLELLGELPRTSLLDVGCGSGVLSIAAARLGFDPVTALDRDQAAVEAAFRNAAANDVAVDVRRADVEADALPRAETAVANINERLVAAAGRRVDCDTLVTSGYFEPHVPDLPGFRRVDRRALDGWAADRFERE
jgi:ribosomal protein L11 methyltransferase